LVIFADFRAFLGLELRMIRLLFAFRGKYLIKKSHEDLSRRYENTLFCPLFWNRRQFLDRFSLIGD